MQKDVIDRYRQFEILVPGNRFSEARWMIDYGKRLPIEFNWNEYCELRGFGGDSNWFRWLLSGWDRLIRR